MAVFTQVSLEDARAYLSAYDIGDLLHLEGIEEGVSNTNFKVETTTGLYALTLFEAATPEDGLPWFMDYTLYLDRKGYPAPGPALKRDGESSCASAIARQICKRIQSAASYLKDNFSFTR